MKKNLFFIAFIFLFILSYSNVYAEVCTQFEIKDGGFPIHSVTVNDQAWTCEDDKFDTNNGNYTIVILAGKKGDEFPELSTPGGLGEVKSVINPNATGENDKYKFTVTVKNHNNGACSFIGGLELKSGPEPQREKHEETANVTITIEGSELEYHYVEDKPNEADVTYFKFDINGGTEEERLVPFTFGNAEYTHNNNQPPKNVDKVTTKSPIQYKYQYDNSGYVEFCVNGGQTDEYTSIKINDVEYSKYAAHTKEDYWETTDGWAQMFCIPNVPYSKTYKVVVKGKQTSDENKIPGFGWSYLTKERSADIDEEGNFAHGRLEFVSASMEIDGELKTFSSASAFNSYKYHGKGFIFQWGEGQKDYPEEDRRLAWGSAKIPYGTTLRVRIVPDEGYQLTGLAVSENGFKATETPGEYELTLTRTNLSYDEDQNQFNLNPKFEKVDATANSKSSVVPNVVLTINNGENAFKTGTPKLEVTDVASMSKERESEFDKAVEDGFTINKYLELSLYNTLYKGGKKDGDKLASWDTEIHDLQNKATIGLELDEALNGSEVQVVHEVRDNDNKIVGYDVIDAQYDKDKNIVTFETDGFSTYAIAVKEEENTPDEKDEVTVEFDSCGGTQLSPIKLHRGDKLEKPEDPENGKCVFEGWFSDEALHDEYDFNQAVNNDLILYAKWSDDENENKNTEYTPKDENGNTITFKEEDGHTYTLEITDYLSYTKEELMKKENISSEAYDQVFNSLTDAMKPYGAFIGFYNIEIKDEDGHAITEGPFEIKIKMTDAMKKYSTFKLVYVDDDMKVGDVIELKRDGDHLVGTLPHLSNYLLGASGTAVPDVPVTSDNIYSWVIALIASIIGVVASTLYIKKTCKVRVK